MMNRVRPELEVSYDMNDRFYAPDAARSFARFFEQMAAGADSAMDVGTEKRSGSEVAKSETAHAIIGHTA
jgi:hypothetical protein